VAILLAWNGDQEEAHRVMEDVLSRGTEGYGLPATRAIFYFALGELDECFKWMERAVEVRDPRLLNVIRSPKTDTIRDDPRFHAILKKMGLEP
jgi:hypothetical protein